MTNLTVEIHDLYASSQVDDSVTSNVFEGPGCQEKVIFQKKSLVPLAGMMLLSSIRSLPIRTGDYQAEFLSKTAMTTTVSAEIPGKVIGRRISRAEALALCQKIMEDAEQRRLEFAEWEAERGLPKEIYQ
jgi:hypothetical protein